MATAFTLIGWIDGYFSSSSNPSNTRANWSLRVSFANFSRISESRLTLIRVRPASASAPASCLRRIPLVVRLRLRSPSILRNWRTRSGISLRTSGSPPVKRICSIPILTATLAMRSISSYERISAFLSHGKPSAGIQ